MIRALEKSLYVTERTEYEAIRRLSKAFNSNYTGSNIIQDDIFVIADNYVAQHDMHLELFRYPLGDDDLCAFTFIREDRVFVVINASMTLSKQLFATAHELYHIYRALEEDDPAYWQRGSILDSTTLDEETSRKEDAEANAFAGLILAPPITLREQMDIYGINSSSIGLKEIVRLMDIFAMPYKAIVLRLFEEGVVSEDGIRKWLSVSEEEVLHQCGMTGRARRWLRTTEDEISFGSLLENMDAVSRLDDIDSDRLQQDVARIEEIMNSVSASQLRDRV